jgi:lipopolysaccharide/colanic/teichoic acid biosynthesis glycosyltransferase
MLMLACLVKATSRGPIFVRQERIGLRQRHFAMLKFRSMRVDAEDKTGPVLAQKRDPRCTPLGAFMRRMSLDELPQLINVLRGDMSLVGPRPERPYFVRQLVQEFPNYLLRCEVRPGITGWAQVSGLRGNTSVEKRLAYDLYYINNWSLRFDLYVLLLTPLAGLTDKNAY